MGLTDPRAVRAENYEKKSVSLRVSDVLAL